MGVCNYSRFETKHPSLDDMENEKTVGRLTSLARNSRFSQSHYFLSVFDDFLIWNRGGGVYRVIIRFWDFGPKQGAVYIREGGLFVMKETVITHFSVFFYLLLQLEELPPPPSLKNKQL